MYGHYNKNRNQRNVVAYTLKDQERNKVIKKENMTEFRTAGQSETTIMKR
jgi:hypothetical protein